MPHARFQLTEADVVAAAKADWWLAAAAAPFKSWLGSVPVVFVAFSTTTWLLHQLSHHHDQLQDDISYYVLAPLGVAFFYNLLLWNDRKWTVIRRFHRDPAASAPCDIAWDEAGLDAAPQGSERVPWAHFERWGDVDGAMLLYRGERDYLVLPARAFGAGELATLRACLMRAGVPETSRGLLTRATR